MYTYTGIGVASPHTVTVANDMKVFFGGGNPTSSTHPGGQDCILGTWATTNTYTTSFLVNIKIKYLSPDSEISSNSRKRSFCNPGCSKCLPKVNVVKVKRNNYCIWMLQMWNPVIFTVNVVNVASNASNISPILYVNGGCSNTVNSCNPCFSFPPDPRLVRKKGQRLSRWSIPLPFPIKLKPNFKKDK